MRALVRAGQQPDAAYNNCSGKHTGFLTTARPSGASRPSGYIRYEHPVQQRLLGDTGADCGLDLSEAPRGIDGCGIPIIAIPLGNMAHGHGPAGRSGRAAAGAGRGGRARGRGDDGGALYGRRHRTSSCSELMDGSRRQAGAQSRGRGSLCGDPAEARPWRRVKAEDGTSRAAQVAVGRILEELGVLTSEEKHMLADRLTPPVMNRAGLEVGRIRPAADAAF